MTKKMLFVMLMVFITVTISGCVYDLGSNEPEKEEGTSTQPEEILMVDTKVVEPSPTEEKVVVEATSTPEPTEELFSWLLPDPPATEMLPTELSPSIKYIEPPENCSEKNDPNVTCTTKKGQVTSGDFILKSGIALVMTGDDISISDSDGILVTRPSLDTVHDLWVVVNTGEKDLELHMYAPHGSFRGYFSSDEWTVQKVSHLRNLHLYLFLLPEQTYDRFTPTPVPNCESWYGCDMVNVRVLVFDDGWNVAGYGLYLEVEPWWQDLLKFLGL